MKQKRTYVTLLLVLAILGLGIAYAAIQNVTLQINATVSETGSNEDIKVSFKSATTDGSTEGVTVNSGISAEGTLTANLSVKGLKKENDKAVVVYTIQNNEADINAALSAPVVGTLTAEQQKWLDVTAVLGGDSVEATKTQTLTVTVSLKATPATDADCSAATLTNLAITTEASAKTNG